MSLKRIIVTSIASTLLMVGFASPISAAPLVANGSFENGPVPGFFATYNPGDTEIENWQVESGSVDYIGNTWQAFEGSRSIDMTGNSAGSISQEVSTLPGGIYTLRFYMSGNPAGSPSIKSLDVSAGNSMQNFTYDMTAEGTTNADMKWRQMQMMFTADSDTTKIKFTSLNAGFFGPAIDMVTIDQYLPINKDECMNETWRTFGIFKNQGECISYIATGGKNMSKPQ